jgi:hypothetical protein
MKREWTVWLSELALLCLIASHSFKLFIPAKTHTDTFHHIYMTIKMKNTTRNTMWVE